MNGVLDDDRLGDMLYRLVEAEDAESAYAAALELGRDASDTFEDEDGTVVTLAFLGLADLTEIDADKLGHGVEVYSQILPNDPAEMVVPREELTVFETGDDESDEPD